MSGIKICGLSPPADIQAVNEAGPDYIGFVFAKSRRRVSPEKARALRAGLSPGIRAVGVFVDAALPEILALTADGTLDMVQLHGGEDEAFIRRVQAETGKPIVKAVRVKSRADVLHWRESAADFLLLDNGAGGTGRVFDWSLLPPLDRPWFLAGGLTADNIGAALELRPYCLDVSSGAETDGIKDTEKIKRIVAMVRKG